VTGHIAGPRLEIEPGTRGLQVDTIKAVFTYVIAAFIVVGGFLVLYTTRLDPPESNSQNVALVVSGFIGSAITFVFGSEVQTRTARQAAASTAASTAANVAGLAAANSGVGPPAASSSTS
jgi:peptidoglycan/LPS O-acetylase OafA/YrhL